MKEGENPQVFVGNMRKGRYRSAIQSRLFRQTTKCYSLQSGEQEEEIKCRIRSHRCAISDHTVAQFLLYANSVCSRGTLYYDKQRVGRKKGNIGVNKKIK